MSDHAARMAVENQGVGEAGPEDWGTRTDDEVITEGRARVVGWVDPLLLAFLEVQEYSS